MDRADNTARGSVATERVVVVVDAYSSGVMYAPALRRAGFSPVAVASVPEPAAVFTSSFRPADFDRRYSAAIGGAALVGELEQLDPIAVVPGTESGVELADRLAAELTPHLANDPGLIRARRHKGQMNAALVSAGVPAIRTTCSSDPEYVACWIAQNRLTAADLVVKPAMSAGTDGVTLVQSDTGWRAAMQQLQGARNPMGLVNDEVVVQERAKGIEYVVDTFTHDGWHTVTNICRYRKVHNAANFAVYESVEFLLYMAPGHNALIRYVEQVLDALGIRFGPAHSEIMLTDGGPRLIETNARLAGGGLPGTAQLATGETGVDRLIQYLSGDRDIRRDFTLQRCVMTVLFIAPMAGVIANVEAYDRIRALETCRHLRVNVRSGDTVEATSDLLSTMRLGWAVLAHRDPARVHADHAQVRAIAAEVRIET